MISIVIPSYNSAELLKRNLPGILVAAERSAEDVETVVVDNGSADDTSEALASLFPSVRVVSLFPNTGFRGGSHAGIEASRGDMIVLLSTDVVVEPDFLAPLVEAFQDSSVFAVASVDLESGTVEQPTKLRHPRIKRGFVITRRHSPSSRSPFPTAYAPGGFSAYRRSMLLELGGFDALYEPFYWEDIDLSYMAWKRGWRVLIDTRSRVRHEHEGGTIATHHKWSEIEATEMRNRFLFIWKNITSARLFIFYHAIPALFRLATGWLVGDWKFYVAFWAACSRYSLAIRRRHVELHKAVRSDEDIYAELRPLRR